MARINIEDSIHKDIRFDELSHKLEGKQNALGALVWAWIIAQHYWLLNRQGIPIPVWKQQKIRDEILEVGLAKQDGDFYYVCGSAFHFQWLIKNKNSGKKGGLAKSRNHRGKSLANASETKRTLPSSSSSSSSSNSNSKKESAEQTETLAADAGDVSHPTLVSDATLEILSKTNRKAQDSWIKLYEDPEWIKIELKKANAWCNSNPKRAPKSNWSRFINNWLARGWESYRKTISVEPTGMDQYPKTRFGTIILD